MFKVHFVDEQGKQACPYKPWWANIVPKPGIYLMSDGSKLHAELKITSDWEKVTCKSCLSKRKKSMIDDDKGETK